MRTTSHGSTGPTVLYIAHSDVIGGAETSLLNIVRHAQTGGYDPVAVLLPEEGELARRLRLIGVPIGVVQYHALKLRNPTRYIRTIATIIRWILSTGAEVVHLNHQYLVEFASVACRLTHRPLICGVRNLDSPAWLARNRRFLCRASALVTDSTAARRHLLDHGFAAGQAVVVHPGVGLDQFTMPPEVDPGRIGASGHFGAAPRDGSGERPPHLVGFVGRLVDWKEPDAFVRAAALVRARCPHAQFLVVGKDEVGGAYERELKDLSRRLDLDGSVSFLGFRSDVAQIMRRLSVFVLSSRDEPLGIVVLEAMASGCVVVATSGGGVPDMVTDGVTGYLVPVGDHVALAEAVIRALEMPSSDRRSMVEVARRTVEERFSLEGQVAKLGRLYRDVAGNGH